MKIIMNRTLLSGHTPPAPWTELMIFIIANPMMLYMQLCWEKEFNDVKNFKQ